MGNLEAIAWLEYARVIAGECKLNDDVKKNLNIALSSLEDHLFVVTGWEETKQQAQNKGGPFAIVVGHNNVWTWARKKGDL